MLWNALAPSLSQYRPGDFGYVVLQTISTAIGAGLAVWAADSITGGKCPMLCVVNCVIGATFFGTITGINLLFGGYPLRGVISMLLAICIFIYCAHLFSKSLVPAEKREEEAQVVELFESFAKNAEMTVPQYVRHIRIQAKRAQGMDEADAIRVVEQEDRVRKAKLKA